MPDGVDHEEAALHNQLKATVTGLSQGEAIANVEVEVAGHRLVSSITVERGGDRWTPRGTRLVSSPPRSPPRGRTRCEGGSGGAGQLRVGVGTEDPQA